MIEIIPGILETDFDSIRQKVEKVQSLVDWVHIDVLDNTLIHNVSYNNWQSFKLFHHQIKLEAHLMVADPAKYVEPMVKNGFKRLMAHVESNKIRDFINQGKAYEIDIGVALDGPSPLDLVEPYLTEIDCVLLMMYKAGLSGQTFQPEQLPKIKHIHEVFPDLPIEVDGGIDRQTAPLVIDNGATRLVSTSYLFWKNPQRLSDAIEELKGIN